MIEEFDDIISAHAEQLSHEDEEYTPASARQKARKSLNRSSKYFEDPDSLFDSIEE